ncbi:MAG: DUF4190 domain-containing protein [Anaerolineales bacterium]|nr:DUF4190 domain-containing protein [Anaerolineales bacterium]
MDYNYGTPLPPPQPARTSVLAIISLVAGIGGFIQVLPVIGPIAAIITGHLAKSEINKSGGTVAGGGMATAGLILGYVTLAIGLCAICFFIILPLLGIGLSVPLFNYNY